MIDHRQELFDRVVTHLLTQNRRAYHDGLCVYRDTAGNMCAIGCLINKDNYSLTLENQCLESHGAVYKAVCDSLGYTLSDGEEAMLGNLRNIHDEVSPDKWPIALKELARVEGLTFNA